MTYFVSRMKNNFLHISIAVLLVVLLALLVDPFMLWMPPMAAMGALVVAAALLCLWGGFVMYENVTDERESLHRMHADRYAYLAGIGVLTLALVVQGFAHHVDPWVAFTLAAMVIIKLAARLYADTYR